MIETIGIINTCELAAPQTRFCSFDLFFVFIYYVTNVLCKGNLNYKHNASKVSSSLLRIMLASFVFNDLPLFFCLLLLYRILCTCFCYLLYASLCKFLSYAVNVEIKPLKKKDEYLIMSFMTCLNNSITIYHETHD